MITNQLRKLIALAAGVPGEQVKLEHPELEEHGDYSTNIALELGGGRELAEKIKEQIERSKQNKQIERIEVAGPGFINFWLKPDVLVGQIERAAEVEERSLRRKKIMVEYAHPNTHKEMHIGHMRTLITGEALARILEADGADVFRANYQGDIGPHVAKSIWGTAKILKERGEEWEDYEKKSLEERAHLLGEGYVRGNRDYEVHKKDIDALNDSLYEMEQKWWEVYERTRRWSLDYYKEFYQRFGTKFDKLFFESEMARPGKEMALANVGKVFEESQGAIIFNGEKYGLHKRVFVTAAGNATYEGKELANAVAERVAYEFDRKVHVVANEQSAYFEVVFKAIELVDRWFSGRQKHLAMGMVNLVGRKISSRTGEVVTVDGLLEEVKRLVKPLIKREGLTEADKGGIAEAVTLAAVKYSVLKVYPTMNVAWDLKQSVNLEGNSGPYLQYTYARARSVVRKFGNSPSAAAGPSLKLREGMGVSYNSEELAVLRWIYRYGEVVEEAARRYAPNLVCNFLYELAQRFNTFYNKHRILSITPLNPPLNLRGGNPKGEGDIGSFRLALTAAVGEVLKSGLNLLGIEALERM